MQDGIDLITALASHPETARRLATKLYGYFVSETATPDPDLIERLAAVYLQSGTVIKPVLQRLFTSPSNPSSFFTRYSWPVEFVVRAMKETGWAGFSRRHGAVAAHQHGPGAARAAGRRRAGRSVRAGSRPARCWRA